MRIAEPTYIAIEELVWLQPDGLQARIVARVGLPYRMDDGVWACPAELEGVDGRYPDIGGASSMQALNLAIGLIAERLGHLLERGERLVHAEDVDCPWDNESLASVFGRRGASAP